MTSDPNYYEILGIDPHATVADIQAAIDAKHTRWRRLVNHHESERRRHAEMQLELLQQIRETLLNADRRAAYDASLASSRDWGLIDPAAGGAVQSSAPQSQTVSQFPETPLELPARSQLNPRRQVSRRGVSNAGCIIALLILSLSVAILSGSTVARNHAFTLYNELTLGLRTSQRLFLADQKYRPVVSGKEFNIRTELYSADAGSFTLQFTFHPKFASRKHGSLSFLSGDIVATDNLGVSYQSTHNELISISTTRGARSERVRFDGLLDPNVTQLDIKLPFDGYAVSLPVAPPSDGFDSEATLDAVDSNGFRISMEIIEPYNGHFIYRIWTGDITIVDDQGKTYSVREPGWVVGRLSGSKHRNHRDFRARFEPSLSPQARTITVSSEIMGLRFVDIVQVGLNTTDGVRFDATVSQRGNDEINLDLKVFNLRDSSFVVNFRPESIFLTRETAGIQSPRYMTMGNMASSPRILKPRGTHHAQFQMTGSWSIAASSAMTLHIPTFSGVSDIAVPVSIEK